MRDRPTIDTQEVEMLEASYARRIKRQQIIMTLAAEMVQKMMESFAYFNAGNDLSTANDYSRDYKRIYERLERLSCEWVTQDKWLPIKYTMDQGLMMFYNSEDEHEYPYENEEDTVDEHWHWNE